MAYVRSNIRFDSELARASDKKSLKQSGDDQPLSLKVAATHKSPAVRLVAAVALRKIALKNFREVNGRRSAFLPKHLESLLVKLLDDNDPQVATEAASAIYDTEFSRSVLETLAKKLEKPGLSDPFIRRSIACNYRLGQKENAEALAKFALNQRNPVERRADAIRLLARWSDAPKLDSFLGHYWPIEKRNPDFAKAALQPVITKLLVDNALISKVAVEAALKLKLGSSVDTLAKIVADENQQDEIRGQALQALAQFKSFDLDKTLEATSQSNIWQLRSAALKILAQRKMPNATKLFHRAINSENSAERQAAWQISDLLADNKTLEVLHASLNDIADDQYPDLTSQLDILLSAKKRKDKKTKQLVRKLEQSLAKDKDKVNRHRLSLFGGDVARGRRIFFEKTEVSCLRCHKVNDQGGEVGPDLSEVGKRVLPHKPRNRYLMEAIVDPNKYIAEGFGQVVITDIEGEQHTGIIKEKTKDYIVLMDAEGKKKKIRIDDIDEQKKGNSSMPDDIINKLSRKELRDLIAYLASLQERKESKIKGH